MKVDIKLYEKPIKALLRKRKVSTTVFKDILTVISEFLPCSECGELLPKESFSKSSAFKNRGGRYSTCKECCKDIRRKMSTKVDEVKHHE